MATLRKAVQDDIPEIVSLGVEALTKHSYPGLEISRIKVFNTAVECVTSERNFCYVSEKDGKIVAAVSALVHPMLFHERQQASVLQFYSVSPGEGVKLMRELMRWVDSRPGIKMVCFTMEATADPRIGTLLSRLGLQTELPVYIKIM